MSPDRAYVGIGANLGDRLANLRSVVRSLADGRLAGLHLRRASPVFETSPLGPARYPFLNAVLELDTDLAPELTLAALLAEEQRLGRERLHRWAPRTIDLDLLLLLQGGQSLAHQSDTLTLPHPGLPHRDFVLAPLAALAPNLRLHPQSPPIADLLARLPPESRTILRQLPDPLC